MSMVQPNKNPEQKELVLSSVQLIKQINLMNLNDSKATALLEAYAAGKEIGKHPSHIQRLANVSDIFIKEKLLRNPEVLKLNIQFKKHIKE